MLPVHQYEDGALGAIVTYHVELYNITEITDTYDVALGPHAWKLISLTSRSVQ